MKNPLPCLICGKELEQAVWDGGDSPVQLNHPKDAIGFTTKGHYGSRFFDPARAPVHLELAICDECMNERQDRLRLVRITREPPIVEVVEDAENWMGLT